MTMPTHAENTALERGERAILFIDIVESVRLIDEDEENTVARWLDLVEKTRRVVVPRYGGRLIKGLGDGMLLEFPDAHSAVGAAFTIRELSQQDNVGVEPKRRILLRGGIEFGEVIIDADDIYGRGVNLAARLLTLAGPGETVVSAGVRDQLVDAIDAEIHDLGECYLRHIPHPVRAYRVGPPGERPVIPTVIPSSDLKPTIAVIPFAFRGGTPDGQPLGDIVAEEVIRKLSRSNEMNLISRLSTAALQTRALTVAEIGAHLKADYVLSGALRGDGARITIDAELSEVLSGQIVWTDRLTDDAAALLADGQELIERIVLEVASAVVLRELRKSSIQPLPTLRAYTLLLSAIALMHRLSPHDYNRARELLEALVQRGSRQAIPHAWLANWHVLKVIQGWSDDVTRDANEALENCKWALEADPESSLALAIDGFVHTHLLKRFDTAEELYNQAIASNPSNAMAWLMKGTMHAFRDEGARAVADTEFALRLSPLDPHRFIYDTHCAGAHLTAGNFECARDLAERACRANRHHTSALRVLAVSQWELGFCDEARRAVRDLLKLEPSLTVRAYLKRSPNADFKIGRRVAHVLGKAGVPD